MKKLKFAKFLKTTFQCTISSYYSRSDFALCTRSRWFPEDRWSGAWYQTEEDFWHGGGDATCGNHGGGTHTLTPPLGEERARLHFSFTFASAERKITGSHYARHVGSFMSLSPGPSTFAISPLTFSTTPPLLSPSSSTRSRLLSFATLHPPRRTAREEDIIYFVN